MIALLVCILLIFICVFVYLTNLSVEKLYGNVDSIDERHRHRYEVNPKYIEEFEKAGMKFVGKSDDNERMEILDLENHPYFVAVQYHPEYISRPLQPSAPYLGLIWVSRFFFSIELFVFQLELQAASGELKNVLTHVDKAEPSPDVPLKSPGPFSHVNLFRHA